MREPFCFDVKGSKLFWREIRCTDAPPLYSLCQKIITAKTDELIKQDWLNAGDHPSFLARWAYRRQAIDMMFRLRNHKMRLHHLLPAAAFFGKAEVQRFFQSPKDEATGLSGLHYALLWEPRLASKDTLLGFAILRKTENGAEAEIAGWKHPQLRKKDARRAAVELMTWSQEVCGYKHFVAHISATTDTQFGNSRALASAKKLGFTEDGVRSADDPEGNGKVAQILRARYWTPPKNLG